MFPQYSTGIAKVYPTNPHCSYRIVLAAVAATLTSLLLLSPHHHHKNHDYSPIVGASALNISTVDWNLLLFGISPSYFFQYDCGSDWCAIFGGYGDGGPMDVLHFYRDHTIYIVNAEDQPTPRGGGCLVVLDMAVESGFVMFGGTLADGTITSQTHFYSFDYGYWEPMDDLSSADLDGRTAFGYSVADRVSTFYTFFGTSSRGLISSVYKAVVDVDEYAISWYEMVVSSGPIPSARLGAVCQFVPSFNMSVCFGGNDGTNDLNEAWVFDHTLHTWAPITVPATLLPRMSSSCVEQNNLVICYGGLVSATLKPVQDSNLWIFDVTDMSVYPIPTTSESPLRGGGAFVNLPTGEVAIIGGRSAMGPLGDVLLVQPNYHLLEAVVSHSQPPARSDHCIAELGNGAIIAFGRGTSLVYNDVFYFDNAVEAFFEIVVTGPKPLPRYGSSAAVIANSAYFFGGMMADGTTVLSDLWRLNVNVVNRTATWDLITPTAPTVGRAFHTSFVDDYRIFVLGGVLGTIDTFTGDMSVFEILDLTWRTVAVEPPLHPRAAHGQARSLDGKTLTVLNGRYESFGAVQLLSDVHQLTVPDYGVYVSYRTTMADSGYGRSDFAMAYSGNNIIVCGGITLTTPMVRVAPIQDDACHSVYIEGGNTHVTVVPVADNQVVAVGGRAWAVGSRFYFFGGTNVRKQIEIPTLMNGRLNYIEFAGSLPLCRRDEVNDSACIHCALGSLNPPSGTSTNITNEECTVAAPGYFIRRPYTSIISCNAGTYSQLSGASTAYACSQCAAGTYTSEAGSSSCLPCTTSSCPVGSTGPNQTGIAVSTRLSSSQPEEFPEGALPDWMWSLIGVLVFFGILIIGSLGLGSHKMKNKLRARYFPGTAITTLRAAYEVHKSPHFGVNSQQLMAVLKDLGVKHVTARYAQTVLAENDKEGTGHLNFANFQDAVIEFIEKGFLPPFTTTHTTATERNPTLEKWEEHIAKFNLKGFDAYDTAHSLGADGEPMMYHTTTLGGIVRVAFYVFAIPLTLLLVGQFFYINIVETKSIAPSVTKSSQTNTKHLELMFTAVGGVLFESDCQQNRDGLCATEMVYSVNNEYVNKYDELVTTCTYNASIRGCTFKVMCDNCAFDYDSDLIMSVQFPSVIYATSVVVSGAAFTGIEDTQSRISVSLEPSSSNVFRGFPASTVSLGLTPTQFTQVDNVIQQNRNRGWGYHVQYVGSTPGQSVAAQDLERHLSVPITLKLSVSDGVLEVSRLPQSSLLDLISQLLGSIPGMGGILVLLMGLYEGKFISRRHEKVRGEMEKDMCKGNGVSRPDDDDGGDTGTLTEKLIPTATGGETVNIYSDEEAAPTIATTKGPPPTTTNTPPSAQDAVCGEEDEEEMIAKALAE